MTEVKKHFEVGDKVICVRELLSAGLIAGNLYEVIDRRHNGLLDLAGIQFIPHSDRFELGERHVKDDETYTARNLTPSSPAQYAELGSGYRELLQIDAAPKHESTLPIDSTARKDYPLYRGCLRYFPAALAGVAKTSKLGNDKHNPGQELHHAREKSTDHGDCIIRHLIDLDGLLSALDNGKPVVPQDILTEVDCLAWRALALSQVLHEKFGAPLAPGAKEGKK